MRGFFVTGTDTGVGKTVLSGLLVSALRAQHFKANYLKPIQTGTDSDTATVSQICGGSLENTPEPFYFYPEPMAPSRAAQLHSEEIRLEVILNKWRQLPDEIWIVEGAGGLLVPINGHHTMRDLALALELPLIVAASTRLGTINHCLLTLEAASAKQMRVAGVFLLGEEDPGLEQVIRNYTSAPVIHIPYLNPVSYQSIQNLVSKSFPLSILKEFL